jgi:hypothetical protein
LKMAGGPRMTLGNMASEPWPPMTRGLDPKTVPIAGRGQQPGPWALWGGAEATDTLRAVQGQ